MKKLTLVVILVAILGGVFFSTPAFAGLGRCIDDQEIGAATRDEILSIPRCGAEDVFYDNLRSQNSEGRHGYRHDYRRGRDERIALDILELLLRNERYRH